MRFQRCAVLMSWMLLCGLSAAPASAQQARTLAIQAGEVYIDGQRVPQNRLPASWNPGALEFQCTFTGNARPVLELDGQLYRLEDDGLSEVETPGAAFVTVCLQSGAAPAPPPPAMGVQSFAVGRAVAVPTDAAASMDVLPGQELLEQQARELEQLSQEVLAFRMPAPGVVSREAVTPNAEFGRIVLDQSASRRQLEEAHARGVEIGPIADKLQMQAERTMRAARQLPQIEIRNYLNDIQEHNRELYQRLIREQQLEQESLVLAGQLRQLAAGPARQERETVLRGRLEEIFALRQENRRREIQQLSEQLSELQRRLDERERLHGQIIENRLKQLTGQATGDNW